MATDIYKRQRGNALFLILIAVALFAALSYAVTRSSRNTGAGADREQAAIIAAQITQAGAGLRTAVLRMKIQGTPLADIEMHTVGGLGDGVNTSSTPCTTGVACLFAPEGGATTPVQIPTHGGKAADLTPKFRLFEIADNAIIDGVAGNEPVLVLLVSAIGETICKALNKGLGIDGIPQATFFAAGVPVDAASGEQAVCFQASNAPTIYTYYHVLGMP